MKRFMLLHYGFEGPTQEIMDAWGKWMQSTAGRNPEHGGFHAGGLEISHDGRTELPLAADSITGYSIIEAESLEDAEAVAAGNPFIRAIRIYEITGG